MILMRVSCFLFFLSLLIGVKAQLPSRFGLDLALVKLNKAPLPLDLASSRSVVIFEGDRKGWQEKCAELHKMLVPMGIDPILYSHVKDFHANGSIRRKYVSLFARRAVANTIICVATPAGFSMTIVANKGNGELAYESGSWEASGADMRETLLTLGLAVKSADFKATNFLALSEPEFADDIDLFSGRRYLNYSGAIRRQKVGLALFEKFPSLNMGDTAGQLIAEYNQQIDQANEELKELFSRFQWDWQPLIYESNENTLKEGIQYVINVVGTEGETVKRMLDYPQNTNETQYISVTPGPVDGSVSLKRIASTDDMFKIYIRQVRADDLFLGEEWDADQTWQQAFDNFFLTLQRQFE